MIAMKQLSIKHNKQFNIAFKRFHTEFLIILKIQYEKKTVFLVSSQLKFGFHSSPLQLLQN